VDVAKAALGVACRPAGPGAGSPITFGGSSACMRKLLTILNAMKRANTT